MLAVGIGSEEVKKYMHDPKCGAGASIAAINSPKSITIAGDQQAIKELEEVFRAKNIFARTLQTGDNAYHSSHMLAIGLDYEVLLSRGFADLNASGMDYEHRYPKSRWVSSVSPGERMAEIRPFYWRQNLESPVQFLAAMEQLLHSSDTRPDILIEIGPHAALKGPINQILAASDDSNNRTPLYLPSIKRGENGMRNLLELCGSLFIANTPVDLVAVNSIGSILDGQLVLDHGCVSVNMPPYSFSYGQILYQEGRLSRDSRLQKHLRHDILGTRQPGSSKSTPTWRNVLRVRDVPWLDHHKVRFHLKFFLEI
jgi:acyl transferase domain-containing protein